jgi:hypothetical protein
VLDRCCPGGQYCRLMFSDRRSAAEVSQSVSMSPEGGEKCDDFLKGYILAEPMASRTHTDYVRAFKKIFAFFSALGRHSFFQRLDNETSAAVETYLRSENISLQYCPTQRNAVYKHLRPTQLLPLRIPHPTSLSSFGIGSSHK